MTSSQPLIDQRGAAFARLAARVVETLNEAVDRRRAQGITPASIAKRIGHHRSALSRALNGSSSNLTLRTISDILWATDHDPAGFAAYPLEDICQAHSFQEDNIIDDQVSYFQIYGTKTVTMDPELWKRHGSGSIYEKVEETVAAR